VQTDDFISLPPHLPGASTLLLNFPIQIWSTQVNLWDVTSQSRHCFDIQPLFQIELRVAFLKLPDALPVGARIRLFIDGLMSTRAIMRIFVKSIRCQTKVKVVLSSCPISECVDAFKNCMTSTRGTHSRGYRGMRLKNSQTSPTNERFEAP
jgi:hypothetical protein